MPEKIKKPSGLRAETIPYRVYLTWDMTYSCNYQCTYCSLGKGEDFARKPKTVVQTPKFWENIWRDIYERYGSCQVHITGGEPFNYPGAMKIIASLVNYHTFECSTNLSWDPEDFIKSIPPDRARIGTSYHPEMTGFEEFFTKVKKLKEAGYEVWTNYVAYPPFINDLKTAKDKFSSISVNMSILPFNGRYADKDYPEAYTESERKYLNELGADLPWVKKTMDWMMNEPKKKKLRSKKCLMGMMYAKIHPDGKVYRCCAEEAEYLGNIMDDSFSLLEEAKICESENCPCWKSMVVEDEGRWADHWPVPPAAWSENDGK